MFRIKAPTVAATSATTATSSTIDNNGNYFFHRKLQNLCRNGRSFQRFSAANAEILANYLCYYYPNHTGAIRTNQAPSHTPHTKINPGTSTPSVSQLLPPVHEQYFVGKDYVENVLNGKIRSDAPPPCVLPLPEVAHLHQQVIDGTLTKAQIDEMLQPRELYHISALEGYEHYDWTKYDVSAGELANATAQAADKITRNVLKSPTEYSNTDFKVAPPRDALTGNYFQREEMVDNLLAAARHFKYQNPFWLRSTHPQLHKYLKLAAPGAGTEGADSIGSSTDSLAGGGKAVGGQEYNSFVSQIPCLTLSLSSTVFFLEDLQPKFPVQFLHPLLVPDPKSPHVAGKQLSTCYDLKTNAAKIQRGMNAATGFVSSNPYFTITGSHKDFITGSHSPSGVWLSLDQVHRYGLTLKDGRKPEVILTIDTNSTPSQISSTGSDSDTGSKKQKKGKVAKGKKKSVKDSPEDASTPSEPSKKPQSTNPFSKRHQQWTGNGRLIEIDEWELYNAAQLAVPGRVALNQAAVDDSKPNDELFK